MLQIRDRVRMAKAISGRIRAEYNSRYMVIERDGYIEDAELESLVDLEISKEEEAAE